MAKNLEFYKGKRKRRNYTIIPIIIILALIALVMITFYSMQKYAVITKDGVSVELPILAKDDVMVDETGSTVKVFDAVDVSLILDEQDYSRVRATAGERVPEIRAIFVPSSDLNADKLEEYAGRLSTGNALILEMKPRNGQLMWNSSAQTAMAYGISNPSELTDSMPTLVAGLKEKGIYLAAQISCCLDETLVSRSTAVALRTEYGANYSDTNGTWLDPYNTIVRSYAAELTQELYDMGFDEVILADVLHPTIPEPAAGTEKIKLVYSREMSTTPGAVNAVCGFAISVSEMLIDREKLLSIYCYSAPALVKSDPNTGQNAIVFMKVFDRVYYNTDKYAYPYNVADIENNVEIGNIYDRLVPVVINYLPENSSWVLVDDFQEEED